MLLCYFSKKMHNYECYKLQQQRHNLIISVKMHHFVLEGEFSINLVPHNKLILQKCNILYCSTGYIILEINAQLMIFKLLQCYFNNTFIKKNINLCMHLQRVLEITTCCVLEKLIFKWSII